MLDWIIPRRSPLQALRVDMLQESHDLDAQDISFLTALAGNSKQAQVFWCTCLVIQPLVNFGHEVVTWLHSCACGCGPTQECNLKGRRSIELASGKASEFVARLSQVKLTKFASEAHRSLLSTDAETANNLLSDFNSAKAHISLRMQQTFGFWRELPWSLLQVGECLVCDDPCLSFSV